MLHWSRHRSTRPTKRQFRPSVEPLEDRRLLAGFLDFAGGGGTLPDGTTYSISGDYTPDGNGFLYSNGASVEIIFSNPVAFQVLPAQAEVGYWNNPLDGIQAIDVVGGTVSLTADPDDEVTVRSGNGTDHLEISFRYSAAEADGQNGRGPNGNDYLPANQDWVIEGSTTSSLMFTDTEAEPANTTGFAVAVIPLDPDLIAKDLTIDNGNVNFSYEVTGANLTQDVPAFLYWASGPTESDILDLATTGLITIPQNTPLDMEVTEQIPFADLIPAPAGSTHLVAVIDPATQNSPNGIIDESDETNNVKSVPMPDIDMLSAQIVTANSIQFTYQTTGNPGPFKVALFRSANETYELGVDRFVQEIMVTPNPTNPQAPGILSTDPIPISSIAPDLPYLLVVADPVTIFHPVHGEIVESDETNNTAVILVPDLEATSLIADFQRLGFSFSYKIYGGDRPVDTTAAFYWSDNETFEPGSDTIASSIPVHGEVQITVEVSGLIMPSSLSSRPPGSDYLLLVLDPWTEIDTVGSVIENREDNNVKALRVTFGILPPSGGSNNGGPGNGDSGNDDPPPSPIFLPVPNLNEIRLGVPRFYLPQPNGRAFILQVTQFDDNDEALSAIQTEWKYPAHDSKIRMENLREIGTSSTFSERLNGDHFLTRDGDRPTAFDANAVDVLFGGLERDWFLFNRLTD